MQSKAPTVEAYLDSLPDDRRKALEAVRKVIRKNLDKDYEEGMQYGMIGYYVPHRMFPAGYHCDPMQPLPFAGLASQKKYMSVYLMCCWGDGSEQKALEDGFKKAGKKLDMGKCCIRFKKLDDLPVQVIGEVIRRVPAKKFISYYESMMEMNQQTREARKVTAGKKKKTVKRR